MSAEMEPGVAATPDPGSVVTTDHLSKWYGQVIGLNDVTLTIGPGVTGLLGPNGAGKSTLLKLITGQLKPSKGTVAGAGRARVGKSRHLPARWVSARSRTRSTTG